jgi:hypothetical protein
MSWTNPVAAIPLGVLVDLLGEVISFTRGNLLVATIISLLVACIFALGLGCLHAKARRRATADGSEADYREPEPPSR